MRITSLRKPKPNGPFERCLAALSKPRRYPNAAKDIHNELAELMGPKEPPIPCPPRVSDVPGIGIKVLKVRVRSSDMKSGKSGGFRVLLVLCDESSWEWAPFFAYAKVDREDVPRAEVLALLKEELASA